MRLWKKNKNWIFPNKKSDEDLIINPVSNSLIGFFLFLYFFKDNANSVYYNTALRNLLIYKKVV